MPEKLRGVLKMFNSQDHTLEVNLLAFATGILAAIVWLTWWFYTGPRDGNLVAAFAAFLTAVTGGLFKRGSSAPNETKAPGTPGEGGQ